MEKEIHFYLNLTNNDKRSDMLYTFLDTKTAIENNQTEIHTTSIANLGFAYLLDAEYRIYAHKDGKVLELSVGMKNISGRDIRKSHNMERILRSGFFDDDFNNI